jgi:hypothetical protein
MISDTLSDAIHAIREYLEDPATSPCYADATIRHKIHALVNHMDEIRALLDTPRP